MRNFKFFIVALILVSCNRDDCSDKLDFKLDYHLFESIKVDGNDYCDLVLLSLENDKNSVINISKVDLSDFASYQHGAVLINVIEKYGEDRYIKDVFNDLSNEKRNLVIASLKAGVEFYKSSKKRNLNDFNTSFPKLSNIQN